MHGDAARDDPVLGGRLRRHRQPRVAAEDRRRAPRGVRARWRARGRAGLGLPPRHRVLAAVGGRVGSCFFFVYCF